MEQKSNCCNSSVKVMGDTTHYYQCEECNKPCDIGGNEIEKILKVAENGKFSEMSDEELLVDYRQMIELENRNHITGSGIIGKYSVDEEKNELLKRLQNNSIVDYKKRLVEEIENFENNYKYLENRAIILNNIKTIINKIE